MTRSLQVSDTISRATLRLHTGEQSIAVSCAHHAALDPCADAFIRVADTHHAFAAVLTASSQCPAFGYLRMKLHKQVLSELEREGSAASFEAAIRVLDQSWQRMHPFHTNILDGFKGLSMALADAHRQMVYLISYGNSRAACTYRDHSRRQTNGSISVPHGKDLLRVDVVPLEEVSTIVVGSSGLWVDNGVIYHSAAFEVLTIPRSIHDATACIRALLDPLIWQHRNEVHASKALLRLQAFRQLSNTFPATPGAAASSTTSSQAPSNESSDDSSESTSAMSSSASHLVNYALHGVTQRMQKMIDPRMRALSSVTALQSLWVGSRANHDGHSRTPVRRKRGDVHGDLTAVVIELQEPDMSLLSPSTSNASFDGERIPSLTKPLQEKASQPQQQESEHSRAASLWSLLRMHFLGFRRTARQQAIAQWRAVAAEAVQQAAAAQHPVSDRIPAIVQMGKLPTTDVSESAASIWPAKVAMGQALAQRGGKALQPTQISVRAAWPSFGAVPAVAASA